ncbi:MAG: MFS transporter [Clostridia bacterium]|nr:MFS transporter [Clostridia bacterium]
MSNKTRILKLACYSVNVTMSAVATLSPLLFMTFRSEYGISYSLLGLLVVINFSTQLLVDLIFSFFSHKFNMSLTVKSIPYIAMAGFIIYALSPFIFKNNIYVGLALGTVVFSAASGLGEVLISPVIAALPSDNPEREMSKLHSVYAWGVVFIVTFATSFLFLFGEEKWQILALLLSVIPLVSAVLFFFSEIPKMETPEKVSGAFAFLKRGEVWLCFFAIFLGGAIECTMAQWASGYIEKAIGIPKIWGDIFGVALFGLMMGIGRSAYAKKGKNIEKVLFFSAIGAFVCYFLATVSNIPFLGLCACAMTGLFSAMLWPGSLVVSSKKIPDGGVFIFALMAAGGDMGASLIPQAVGIITDSVAMNASALNIAERLGLSVEELSMKAGMSVGMLVSAAAIIVYFYILKKAKRV